jgi:hypothetical protein
MVERQHGEGAPAFIAERTGALALAGDVAGIARWNEIAARIDQLRGMPHPSLQRKNSALAIPRGA